MDVLVALCAIVFADPPVCYEFNIGDEVVVASDVELTINDKPVGSVAVGRLRLKLYETRKPYHDGLGDR